MSNLSLHYYNPSPSFTNSQQFSNLVLSNLTLLIVVSSPLLLLLSCLPSFFLRKLDRLTCRIFHILDVADCFLMASFLASFTQYCVSKFYPHCIRAIICPMRQSLGEHITIYFLLEDILFFFMYTRAPLFIFIFLQSTQHYLTLHSSNG